MIEALKEVEVVTLFVEDLTKSTSFYTDIFGLHIVYQDSNCAVLKIGSLMINVLKITEAQKLVDPATVADAGLGSRLLFTIKVQDVNGVCEELKKHGVSLLNGPMDRPWGRRTAAFADPAGNVWEVAQEIK
jgi:catechol 2,3-dioxygenase-like lactoylglutathione lyase family enzyme